MCFEKTKTDRDEDQNTLQSPPSHSLLSKVSAEGEQPQIMSQYRNRYENGCKTLWWELNMKLKRKSDEIIFIIGSLWFCIKNVSKQ